MTSAGTRALIGQPVSTPMDVLMADVGADPTGFVARQLSAALLRESDLVLTMTRDQRRAVVELNPAVVRRCFTLREYARLLNPGALIDGSPADRARASLPRVAAARRAAPADQDNIADPFRRGDHAYAAAFAEVQRAVASIARMLAPGRLDVISAWP